MDFFTHFLVAVLVGNLLIKELNFQYVIFIGILAIFPDLDIFIEPLKKVWHTYYILHRGASHSYFTGIFISAIAAGIFSIITGNFFFEAWLVGYLAFSLHVTLDFLTTSKVPAFFPFKRKEYRLILERAVNPFVMLPSIVLFVFFGIRVFYLPLAFLFDNYANFYLGAYLTYFLYRLFLKLRIQSLLPETHHYIPGTLPYVYLIYEKYNIDNMKIYLLQKNRIFSSKKQKLFDIHVSENSENMKFFNKSMEESKKYRFFSKWEALIPIFKENDNKIFVTLVLAESLSRKRCYQLILSFDKNSGNLINEIDGFFLLSDNFPVIQT